MVADTISVVVAFTAPELTYLELPSANYHQVLSTHERKSEPLQEGLDEVLSVSKTAPKNKSRCGNWGVEDDERLSRSNGLSPNGELLVAVRKALPH